MLPKGYVCDQCNQYFGSKLEHDALNSPPFCIERVASAVRTKEGTYASYESSGLSLWSTGRWDHVFVAATPGAMVRPSFPDGRSMLLVPPPKDYGAILSRFLLKMGLELLVLSDRKNPWSREFDCGRRNARFGDARGNWDVGYSHWGRKDDLVVSRHEDELGPLETRELYQYQAGIMPNGDLIFFFMYTTHCFACNLSQPDLGEYIVEFNKMNKWQMKRLAGRSA